MHKKIRSPSYKLYIALIVHVQYIWTIGISLKTGKVYNMLRNLKLMLVFVERKMLLKPYIFAQSELIFVIRAHAVNL